MVCYRVIFQGRKFDGRISFLVEENDGAYSYEENIAQTEVNANCKLIRDGF